MDMFGFGMGELLVILGIVLVLFGPKRLKSLGSDLGNAIKGFRTAVKEEEPPPPSTKEHIIEGEVHRAPNDSAARKQDTNV
jgi:sec-independent protein translocase protein TatA